MKRSDPKKINCILTYGKHVQRILFKKTYPLWSDLNGKVDKILKGSLDSIQSPSPSVKIQIMGGKVCTLDL